MDRDIHDATSLDRATRATTRPLWLAVVCVSILGALTPMLPWERVRAYSSTGALEQEIVGRGFGGKGDSVSLVGNYGLAGAVLLVVTGIGAAVARARPRAAGAVASVGGLAAAAIAVACLRERISWDGTPPELQTMFRQQLRFTHEIGPYALFCMGILVAVLGILLGTTNRSAGSA